MKRAELLRRATYLYHRLADVEQADVNKKLWYHCTICGKKFWGIWRSAKSEHLPDKDYAERFLNLVVTADEEDEEEESDE